MGALAKDTPKWENSQSQDSLVRGCHLAFHQLLAVDGGHALGARHALQPMSSPMPLQINVIHFGFYQDGQTSQLCFRRPYFVHHRTKQQNHPLKWGWVLEVNNFTPEARLLHLGERKGHSAASGK